MTDKITFTSNGERHELPIDSSKTLRVGNVSPSTKLYLIPMPQDAMGSDPKERIRISGNGSMFIKDEHGSVFGVTDMEPEQ